MSETLEAVRAEDPPMLLTEHLGELRHRLLASLGLWALATALVYSKSGELLTWLARPAGGLVFQAPAEAFYTRLKVAAFGGIVIALPLVLHQAWLFVARAVEPRWRRLILGLLPVSYALFILGSGIALFAVVPTAVKFLLGYGADGVTPLLGLGAYLDFVTGLSLAFGGVFQLPLVLYGLNKAGILPRARLAESRRLVYLLCFIGGAVLTPGPDVVLQLALSLPAAVLFELTLLFMSR